MAIIGGGEKMLTRAAFNDALGYNKLTDDTKIIKIEDIYKFVGENNSFGYGNYVYHIGFPTERCSSCGCLYDEAYVTDDNGSSWTCKICALPNAPANRINRCLRCQDVSINKWNDSTWTMNVTFGQVFCNINQMNHIPYTWESQGGGLYTASETVIFIAEDASGDVLYEEAVDAWFEGYSYRNNKLEDIGGGLNGNISFSFKKSNPPTVMYLRIDAYAVLNDISQGGYVYVNPTSSETNYIWEDITFNLRY